MVSIFLAQAIDDGRIHVKGNLNRFRDFIYIDDVVEAWYKLCFNNAVNATINLGTGRRTSIEELLLIIKKNFKNIDYYSSGSTPGDQKGIYADNSLFKNLIDKAQFTKLEDGIRLFCDSIK